MFLPLLVFFNLPMSDARLNSAEARALTFLAREVPRWHAENKCFSCHNNGDAARALYSAIRISFPVKKGSLQGELEDTTRWLVKPRQWDHNKGDPGFSDKGLARIQFAAALVEAVDAGVVKGPQPLAQAAELVAENQKQDGSWRIDVEGAVGSPATYGSCLATVQAGRVLKKADPERYRPAIKKAEDWLRRIPTKNVLDTAAVLRALSGARDCDSVTRNDQCLAFIRKAEADKGGWGPYLRSGPEPFDTAVVLLALVDLPMRPEIGKMIDRGRALLLATQERDGSWPETTRPAGGNSYAQHVSTTAWATMALLATRPHVAGPSRRITSPVCR